jgi:SGNH hydrolase-like domain, acetyltransferase AlgX
VAGLVGEKGFLVFRRELDYLQAPDWQSPQAKHHPLPVILELKAQLAKQGIDFLFIPIPTKLDIYPEMVGAKSSEVPGGIAQPYVRKVLQDLSQAGVETVDLLTPFLKACGDLAAKKPLLYQFEDTHWAEQGLRLAANTLAARVREYPWYAGQYAKPYDYAFKDTAYTVLGDIQSRLSDSKKSQIRPETVTARQVLQDGKLYQDEDGAPVLILGDSYTGVFQTVGCRHAGVTAQLASELKGPVSLVMGWGGGPEAPRKLAKHGPDFLQPKRLVVWMMSARDLFAYPGNWTQE